MEKEPDVSIKKPQNFEDIRGLIQEYDLNKEYIKMARDGKKVLLGFIYHEHEELKRYKLLDYKFGLIFANALEERNKQIEEYLTI